MYVSQIWRLQVQDQGPGRFIVWWGPTSWFIDSRHSAVSSRGGKGEGAVWGLCFIKALFPFVRARLSRPNHLPKAPLTNTIALGMRIQHGSLAEGHTQSIALPASTGQNIVALFLRFLQMKLTVVRELRASVGEGSQSGAHC